MNKQEAVLNSVIRECKKHVVRLNHAYDKISPVLPFTGTKISSLTEEEVGHLDQYIFRFSKLQEAIGQKLFKNVLTTLGEDLNNMSFIDIFNRLEQLNILDDYDQWDELRELRNEISHEYDDNYDELAEKLNKALKSKVILEQYMQNILTFLKNKGIKIEDPIH